MSKDKVCKFYLEKPKRVLFVIFVNNALVQSLVFTWGLPGVRVAVGDYFPDLEYIYGGI